LNLTNSICEDLNSTLEKFEGNLWGYHISVPNDVAEKFLGGDNRRIILTINDTQEIQCALMPNGKTGWFININKEVRKKLTLEIGQMVDAKIQKDDSKYGLPMPEEMLENARITTNR